MSGPTKMTFATLVQDVQRYLERGNTVGGDPTVFEQIPRLINACERKIIQTLKLQGTIEVLNDPAGFTPGKTVIAKPDRWRETISFSYGSGVGNNERKFLFPRAYEYCRSYWPNDAEQDTTQEPIYYADYNLANWLIVPTSPGTFPIEVLCYMQPPLLCDDVQTNFFTDYTPNMLLYGSLLEATPFIKEDERIPTWEKFWGFEIDTLKGQDLQKILDRSADRSRP